MAISVGSDEDRRDSEENGEHRWDSEENGEIWRKTSAMEIWRKTIAMEKGRAASFYFPNPSIYGFHGVLRKLLAQR